MKTNHKKTKHLFAIMKVFILVGILVFFWDMYDATWGFSQKIERNLPGQGDYQEDMKVVSKYYSGDYKLMVKEQQLTKKQVDTLFAKAREEIYATFFGENVNSDAVMNDVNPQTQYQQGLVRARWSFDEEELVNCDGEIQKEMVEEATIVVATAELRYGEYTDILQFPFQVIPYGKDSEQGFLNSLSRALDREDTEEETLVLPGEIDGEKVKWRKKLSYRGVAVIALGVLGSCMIPYGEMWETKRQKRKKQQAMLWDYPSILNQLSLLLGVGISLPEVVDRITIRYEKQKKETGTALPGYELLAMMNREMKDGVGTLQAIEHFGKNSERKEYRKLAILLQQNLRKGNAHMIELMEREDMEAFEMRKAMARRAGEEASTKLLIPMIGMLGIVIVILVVPALLALESQ
ncbi:MAG: hypothetical protein PUB19_09140 [Lachnospiraceae bacterium]|nr:hypothetical protein [Lachnospiraceae bacterium]